MKRTLSFLVLIGACEPGIPRTDPVHPLLEQQSWEVLLEGPATSLHRGTGPGQADVVFMNRATDPTACTTSYSWTGSHAGQHADGYAGEIDFRVFHRSAIEVGAAVELGTSWAHGDPVGDEAQPWSLSNGQLTVQKWELRERIATIENTSLCDRDTGTDCVPIDEELTLHITAIVHKDPTMGVTCTEGGHAQEFWNWGENPPPCTIGDACED